MKLELIIGTACALGVLSLAICGLNSILEDKILVETLVEDMRISDLTREQYIKDNSCELIETASRKITWYDHEDYIIEPAQEVYDCNDVIVRFNINKKGF